MSKFVKFNPNPKSLVERGSEAPTPELEESYQRSTYAWQPGMMDDDGNSLKLRLTKSSLGNYSWCPYQYKLKHIYRLKEEENEDMVRGTNVHNIVEYYWTAARDVIYKAIEELENGDKRLAKDTLYSIIPNPPQPYLLGEQEVIDQWFEWQWNRFMVTEGVDWLPTGNEVSAHAMLDVEIDGEIIPVHLRGFIDTIFPDGEGGSVLMELKTGKWNPKKAKSMREEMQFYKLMLEEGGYVEYLPVTHWAWEFPRGWVNGGTKAEWELEDTSIRKTSYAPRTVMNNIKKVVKAHMNDSFEPTPKEWRAKDGSTGSNCHYCSFMELCPAWNVEEKGK
tara:strand:- start:7190 stop:8191 length:1002 start_codon:yes stop_codon:yes gene_type:complete